MHSLILNLLCGTVSIVSITILIIIVITAALHGSLISASGGRREGVCIGKPRVKQQTCVSSRLLCKVGGLNTI